MRCPTERLSASFPSLPVDLRGHLAGCAGCRDTWDGYGVLAEAVDAMSPPPDPGQLRHAVARRALLARARLPARRARVRWRRVAGIAAALVAFMVGGSVLRSQVERGRGRLPAFRPPTDPSPETPGPAVAPPTESRAEPEREPSSAPRATAGSIGVRGSAGPAGGRDLAGTRSARGRRSQRSSAIGAAAIEVLRLRWSRRSPSRLDAQTSRGGRGATWGPSSPRPDRRDPPRPGQPSPDADRDPADPPAPERDPGDADPQPQPEAICADVLFARYDQCMADRGITEVGESEEEQAAAAECWIDVANPAFDQCCAQHPDDSCEELDDLEEGPEEPPPPGTACSDLLFSTHDQCMLDHGIDPLGGLDGDGNFETDEEQQILSYCWGEVANPAFDTCCATTPDSSC